MKKLLAALLLSALSSSAFAASGVQQSGSPATPGQVPYWVSNGIIGVGTSANDSPINTLGVTNNNLSSFCISSQRAAAAGRQQLCLGTQDSVGATISLQNYGTDAAGTFNFIVNGTTYPFPGALSQLLIGTTPIPGGSNGNCLIVNGTVLGQSPCAAASITALVGDVTATGPGSVAATLATVNSNVGTFGTPAQIPTITVNGKGLITAISAAAAQLTVGSQPISGGATNNILFQSGTQLSEISTCSAGVIVTSSLSIPACSTNLPSGITLGSVTGPDGGRWTAGGLSVSTFTDTALNAAGVVCNSAAGLLSTSTGSCAGQNVTGFGAYVFSSAPTITNLTVTGSLSATGLVTNADLVSPTIVINSTNCTLGSSCAITATAASITVGTTGIVSSGGNNYLLTTGNAGNTLGNVTAAANISISSTTIGAVLPPQGRLTLISGTPVMNSNQTAKQIIYYDCYVGNTVPVYNGTIDAILPIAACEITDVMATGGAGVINSANVFDIWAVNVSGTLTLCIATNGSGGGWASDSGGGSNTARGTGYSQLDLTTRPYITNKNSITHCYQSTTDEGPISANQATYLGTLYSTATAQTGMNFKPAGTVGGNNNVMGLYNAYNRVTIASLNYDTNSSATNGNTSPRVINNSANNRINIVDGLGQSTAICTVIGGALTATSESGYLLGCNLDTTSGSPTVFKASTAANQQVLTITTRENFLPSIGFHFYQGMEAAANTTTITVEPSYVEVEVAM